MISPSLTTGAFLCLAPDSMRGPLGMTAGDGLVSSFPGNSGPARDGRPGGTSRPEEKQPQ